MPEESHSVLHQGPMGEGKDLCNYIYYAPVNAVSKLASVIIWLFSKWLSAVHLVLQDRTQKCCRAEWKNTWTQTNRGNKAVLSGRERRAQRTSLLQSELAEKLFVWLWSSAKPFHTAETPKRTHIHPERVRITGSQDCLCSQRCWPCMVEGGGTQITYYFSVHYLQLQS